MKASERGRERGREREREREGGREGQKGTLWIINLSSSYDLILPDLCRTMQKRLLLQMNSSYKQRTSAESLQTLRNWLPVAEI